ncbi:membrane protein [Devosia sp. H5989]|nr:membrane protein [Devosia sp. H5989]
MSARQISSRLLWFIGLWAAGVLTVAIVGYAIKLVLGS